MPYSGVLRKFVEYAWKWFGKKIQRKKHDLASCLTVLTSSACLAFDAGELHNNLTKRLSSEKISWAVNISVLDVCYTLKLHDNNYIDM